MQNIKFPFQPDFQHMNQAPAGAAQPAPAAAAQGAPGGINGLVARANGAQQLPAQAARAEHAIPAVPGQPVPAVEAAPDTVSGNCTDDSIILEAAPQQQDNSFLTTPRTMEGAQKLAEYLAPSNIVPAVIRNRPADVFFVLARAASVGLNWSQAFSAIHIIPNPKNGDVTLSMSVSAKAAICAQFGSWEVSVDMQQGKAIATGTRYAVGSRPQQRMSVEYTAYEASLMGRMGRDENGVFFGLKTWESRWPQMLKVRALGRLLDALFPDKIGGFTNKEELDDEAERAMAAAEKGTRARRSKPKVPAQQVAALSSLEDCLVDDETENTPDLTA